MMNSNILIRIFILILFFTSFLSCKKKCDDHGTLTADESAWIPYSGGEQLIFRSNIGDTSYLTVGSVNIWERPVGEDGMCPRSIQTKYVDVGTFGIGISHLYNQYSGISVGNFEYLKFENYPLPTDVIINGVTCKDVYVMAYDTTKHSSTPQYAWKIYYSRQKGILKYDVTGGKSWEKIN